MVFRVLVGIFVGLFLISPIISGDIDIGQISITTQTAVEKVVQIVELIASDGNHGMQGV